MADDQQGRSDFIAPVPSRRNPLLLKIAIGLFVIWIGVLLWIISRS